MSGWTIMAIAWVGVISWISFVIFANRKTHPKALFLLFFAEFWERFSYYGMRALLILYMTSALDYSDDAAFGIYAAYGALVYATPIIGGLVSEKLLGYRKAIFWGGTLMALGHFAMAFEYEVVFYLALALLISGNGFFKPNISSFIANFYEKNDPRKDGAYTIFYMGINAGAMLTPLTCGYIGAQVGWHFSSSLPFSRLLCSHAEGPPCRSGPQGLWSWCCFPPSCSGWVAASPRSCLREGVPNGSCARLRLLASYRSSLASG